MISTDSIKLRVSDITESGVHIEALEEPQWLVNLPELWSKSGEARVVSKIGIDLQVFRVLKEITVAGNIKLTIQAPCSRCVEPVKVELDPHISLVLSPGNKLHDEDDDIDHETYQDDEVDLNNYLREQVAISLPLKVVCSEECKGLCPECGTNLNNEDCGCKIERVDPRFAVLKKLKI